MAKQTQSKNTKSHVSRDVAKTLVATLARANLSLQHGRYITADEIDARREALKQYKFR